MKGTSKVVVALAAGVMIGWFSNAQIVKGQGKQAQTPVLGGLSHVSFAVKDAEKAAAAFAAVFGVADVPKSMDFKDIKWGPSFPGRTMNVKRSGMTINNVSFEILQPLAPNDSPWDDFMKATGGEGLHHLGISVPDVAAARDYLVSKGGVQTQQFEQGGKMFAAYVDMHKAGLPITFEVTPGAPPAAK